jgi:hypothetical protein
VDSPLLTLLALVAGLVGGVLLVAGLQQARPQGARAWTMAIVTTVLVALAASWGWSLRDRANKLVDQRSAYAGTSESAAIERCLHDSGRPDLAPALAFARNHIPEDRRYRLVTDSGVLPCVALNLLPRRPVDESEFDPALDWIVYDAVPDDIGREAIGQQGLPEGERRYLAHTPAFVLVRPGAAR